MRTLTFNMEDALISPISFMILAGAGLMDASADHPVYVHTTEKVVIGTGKKIVLSEAPAATDGEDKACIYAMIMDYDEIATEPYIMEVDEDDETGKTITFKTTDDSVPAAGKVAFVDYYVKHIGQAQQIDITPEQFGGNYYLEASTLFRDERGVDHAAEFVIPNCRVQSNFTFTMSSSGDPSTFNFVLDAFPGYTRWDKTKKVLACLQVLNGDLNEDYDRDKTASAGFPPYAERV